MDSLNNKSKIIISFRQIFLLVTAQMGGASIIYLPGVGEAGRDIWISNIIASIMAYVLIYSHYLPMSSCAGESMTKILNKYWGKFLGGLVNFYYLLFFFILCVLIVSDVFYFGKMTMPETPGLIFIVFFLVPAVYALKLGLEVISRLLEFLLPWIILMYSILFLLTIPKLNFLNLQPIMAEGIKPVLAGALPNANFPFGQILPIAFLFKYIDSNKQEKNKFVKYVYGAIFLSTILLTLRAIGSVAAFEESTLKTLTYPPFSTVRIIEIANVLERLDAIFLATFYATTFFKFIVTFYIICEIISEHFSVGKPSDYSLPVALLIGISMPFLIPRFDIILQTVIPYFLVFLPLFFVIPLLLYLTIKIRKKARDATNQSQS